MVTEPREIEEPRQGDSNFTDISQLVSQRTFSREQAERLICILNSKQVETPTKTHEPTVASVNDETNASPSPIDIAKAFMKNRSSDASAAGSHRSPPSPFPGTATRWPGVLSLHDEETPVKRTPIRGRNFERTPYSRYNYLKNEIITSTRKETRFSSGLSGPLRGINCQRSSSIYEERRQSVGVPPHSSQLARRILEQLDRNPPTPKEKFNEFKFAVLGEHTNLENSRVGKIVDAAGTERNSSVHFQKEVKNDASEKVLVTGSKRMLPPISVGFTFPVALAPDLPTPSMAPTLKSVPSAERVPISYEFGTASSLLDFSFPSVSVSPDFDTMNLKFAFGSNRSLSFSFPDDTVSA